MKQMNTKEGLAAYRDSDDYHYGPAPLGFAKDDGTRIEVEDYHDVVTSPEMVQKHGLSKQKAAQCLDCSRSTILRDLTVPDSTADNHVRHR